MLLMFPAAAAVHRLLMSVPGKKSFQRLSGLQDESLDTSLHPGPPTTGLLGPWRLVLEHLGSFQEPPD